MRINDDKAVIDHLLRHDVAKTLGQTFSSFCQWCADTRTPVNRQLLLCPVCDQGDE